MDILRRTIVKVLDDCLASRELVSEGQMVEPEQEILGRRINVLKHFIDLWRILAREASARASALQKSVAAFSIPFRMSVAHR